METNYWIKGLNITILTTFGINVFMLIISGPSFFASMGSGQEVVGFLMFLTNLIASILCPIYTPVYIFNTETIQYRKEVFPDEIIIHDIKGSNIYHFKGIKLDEVTFNNKLSLKIVNKYNFYKKLLRVESSFGPFTTVKEMF